MGCAQSKEGEAEGQQLVIKNNYPLQRDTIELIDNLEQQYKEYSSSAKKSQLKNGKNGKNLLDTNEIEMEIEERQYTKNFKVTQCKDEITLMPMIDFQSLKAQQRMYTHPIVKSIQTIQNVQNGIQNGYLKEINPTKCALKIGDKVGSQSADYIITSKGIIRGSQVLYNIECQNSIYALHSNKFQLREIHLNSIKDITNTLYCLMQYENIKQKSQDSEDTESQVRFLKIFDYWCDNTAGETKYVLYIVQEKLNLLIDYINQLQKSEMEVQEQKLTNLFQKLYLNNYLIFTDFQDLKYYTEQIIYNIYYEYKLSSNIKESTIIYSFRYKNAFSSAHEEFYKKKITEESALQILLSELYIYLQYKGLDLSVFETKPVQYEDVVYQNFLVKNLKSIKYLSESQQINGKIFQFMWTTRSKLKKGPGSVVYQITDMNHKKHALKQIKAKCFDEFSQLFIQALQIQMFSKNAPLIQIEKAYIEYNDQDECPYTLNILMQKAECSMLDIIKKRPKPLSFKYFFPVFRDAILGLIFLHVNNIAHRNIKPQHILKMKSNSYVLADFGCGINLNYQQQYSKQIFYQRGNWGLAGTVDYLDPILQEQYQKSERDELFANETIDLFKADVYSLGLTLFYIATGQKVRNINVYEQNEQILYKKIHDLNLPLPIKQTIIHMTSFKSNNRIPTYALFNCLKNIMKMMQQNLYKQLYTSVEIKIYKNWIGYDKITDWFDLDVENGNFKLAKLKKQTQIDQSFYSGHLKLNYINEENKLKKLTKKQNTIVLLKPNFIPCAFNKKISRKKLEVNVLNQKLVVKTQDVLLTKLPMYNQNQYFEWFNEKLNQWILCKLVFIDIEQATYQIQFKSKDKKKKLATVQFNSLRLRPLILEKDYKYGYIKDMIYEYVFIDNRDLPLMTYSKKLIDFNQLHHIDFNLNKLSIKNAIQVYKGFQHQKHQNNFDGILHIYVDNQTKSEEVIASPFISKMIIQQLIGLTKCNLDGLKNAYNFSSLTDLDIRNCNFTNASNLNQFLSQLRYSKQLTRICMNDLNFQEESDLSSSHMFIDILLYQPIKCFELYISRLEFSKVKVDLNAVILILLTFSAKKLNSFHLELYEIVSEKFSFALEKEFENSLSSFLKCQTNLDYFYLKLWLNQTPRLQLKSFNYFPKYIKDNKEMIEKLNRFYICIWGNFQFFLLFLKLKIMMDCYSQLAMLMKLLTETQISKRFHRTGVGQKVFLWIKSNDYFVKKFI